MNITITNININAITNIGSLNIGKTIICKNKASITSYLDQEKTDSPDVSSLMSLLGFQVEKPFRH